MIAGNLELVKEQREAGGTYSVALINTVSPGDGLDYRTTYENKGSSALTSVIIYETIPEHTELASATVTLTGDQTGTVEYSVDNATSFSATAPATIADTTNIRVTLNADLLPAQGGTVEYSVTIK